MKAAAARQSSVLECNHARVLNLCWNSLCDVDALALALVGATSPVLPGCGVIERRVARIRHTYTIANANTIAFGGLDELAAVSCANASSDITYPGSITATNRLTRSVTFFSVGFPCITDWEHIEKHHSGHLNHRSIHGHFHANGHFKSLQ